MITVAPNRQFIRPVSIMNPTAATAITATAVATVVAVIAVASVGFLMLTGRINWRYGATVIIGCFILFGAASIVAGIQSTAAVGN